MSNWSDKQFKKAKVKGNEKQWEQASQALEAQLIEQEIQRLIKELKPRLERLKVA